jgi:hypothetical protein
MASARNERSHKKDLIYRRFFSWVATKKGKAVKAVFGVQIPLSPLLPLLPPSKWPVSKNAA